MEDNQVELDRAADITRACGLVTFATRSPRQAIRWLSARSTPGLAKKPVQPSAPSTISFLHSPTVAIIDWNMEMSPDGVADAEETLRALAKLHPGAVTIVYAGGVGMDLRLQERILDAHPTAIPHDKRLGPESLPTRLRKLLSKTVGDLQIDGGRVLHVPTNRRFPHAIAVKFILAHPRPLYIERLTASAQAKWRFSAWLKEVGSSVSVVAQGAHSSFFHLDVAADSSPPDATAAV